MERKDVPCPWVARAEAMCDVGPQLRVRCPPVCSHGEEQNADPALGQVCCCRAGTRDSVAPPGSSVVSKATPEETPVEHQRACGAKPGGPHHHLPQRGRRPKAPPERQRQRTARTGSSPSGLVERLPRGSHDPTHTEDKKGSRPKDPRPFPPLKQTSRGREGQRLPGL